MILPLTGAGAQYGENCRKGIDLAVAEHNAKGDGISVRIICEDDKTEPKEAVSAFNKLVSIDRVRAIIGPLPSSNAMAVAPLANREQVVILSPGASTPRLTKAGPFVFRNWQSDAYEAKVMSAYLLKQGVKRIAVFALNNDFGRALSEYFHVQYTAAGGVITAEEFFDQDATEFRTQLLKLQASHPDGLYLLSYPKETGNIVNQARQIGFAVPVYGVAAMEDPTLLKIAGENADGIVYTKAVEPTANDPVYDHFVKSYRDSYGEDPGLIADTGYDAVGMLLLAIKNASKPDSPSLAQSLGQIRDYSGASGQMSFDENGDIIKPVGLKTVKDGKFIWLDKSPDH